MIWPVLNYSKNIFKKHLFHNSATVIYIFNAMEDTPVYLSLILKVSSKRIWLNIYERFLQYKDDYNTTLKTWYGT